MTPERVSSARHGYATRGFAALLALHVASLGAVMQGDVLVPVPTFDDPPDRIECKAPEPEGPSDLEAVFAAMKTGPQQAVACVSMLEETAPGWHQAPGAESLIDPFVNYLLGDGTARGLQRHPIFIDLLGHLEKIEPGWRQNDAVTRRLPEIILASTVEDPWVSNFWSTTLSERVEEWRETGAVDIALPALYQRALEESEKPAEARNPRPENLLLALSWPRYAKLWLATRVFDSWAKTALLVIIALGLIYLAVRRARRRKRS